MSLDHNSPTNGQVCQQTSSPGMQQHRQNFTAVLGIFLETLTHELLYLRKLYPSEVFTSSRYCGVMCHRCLNPDVVRYVHKTLKVSVPAICSNETTRMYLIFYNSTTDILIEQFLLEFDLDDTVQVPNWNVDEGDHTTRNNDSSSNGKESCKSPELEALDLKICGFKRSLRDVLLKVIVSLHGMPGIYLDKKNVGPDGDSTFKICLHLKGDAQEQQEEFPLCHQLETAINEGAWIRSDPNLYQCSNNFELSNTGNNNGRGDDGLVILTRPLKSICVPSCGFRLKVFMEVPK